jgi:hypothetical protein
MRMAPVAGVVLVSASLALAVDSVHVTPAKPTTRDPLTLELYNGDLCCAVRYYRDTAMQYDTTILLSYEYDDSLCPFILCLVPGSRHEFRLDPVPAGTYGIYKLEQRYCAGPICPQGPIVQRRVGEVTVTGLAATRAAPRRLPAPVALPSLRFEQAAGRVSVVLPGAARCTVEGRVLKAPPR